MPTPFSSTGAREILEMTVEQVRPGVIRIGPFVGTSVQAADRGRIWQQWYDEQQGTSSVGFMVSGTRSMVSGAYSLDVKSDDGSSVPPTPPTELIS